MATSQHGLGGRPKSSGVWQYYKYSLDNNNSECTVIVANQACGKKIAGRNPTNLKVHLASYHKDIFTELKHKEEGLKASRIRSFCTCVFWIVTVLSLSNFRINVEITKTKTES